MQGSKGGGADDGVAQGETRGISGIRETGRWFRNDRVIAGDKKDKEDEGEEENKVLIRFMLEKDGEEWKKK